ncbi:MAG TPA: DUF4058 family protein [Tepidisphaeraceae bacterium]|nr:DUF4058 family protein [Tepidisphaeraceae bacterium]
MRSPFPGMDPYVEATGIWSNFHHALITACHDLLNERLPANYVAAIEERVLMIGDAQEGRLARLAEPDVAVLHGPLEKSGAHKPSLAHSIATIEPRTLPQEIELLDAPKQLYLQVLHLPDRTLVTDIELLSHANKRRGSDDRAAYLSRRRDLILHQVNLVELDLLLKGERLPMLAALPAGDYFAFLTRWQTGRQCDVYAWSIRQALPTIPVPLREGDGEVGLDLASAFSQTYSRGRYDRLLNYTQVPEFVGELDRKWLVERLAEVAR